VIRVLFLDRQNSQACRDKNGQKFKLRHYRLFTRRHPTYPQVIWPRFNCFSACGPRSNGRSPVQREPHFRLQIRIRHRNFKNLLWFVWFWNSR